MNLFPGPSSILILCLWVCTGSIQEETDHFLSQKSEWKLEIEQKLEELKKVESALSCRERELKKVSERSGERVASGIQGVKEKIWWGGETFC